MEKVEKKAYVPSNRLFPGRNEGLDLTANREPNDNNTGHWQYYITMVKITTQEVIQQIVGFTCAILKCFLIFRYKITWYLYVLKNCLA